MVLWLSMFVLYALSLRELEQRCLFGRLVVESVGIVFCFSLRCGKGSIGYVAVGVSSFGAVAVWVGAMGPFGRLVVKSVDVGLLQSAVQQGWLSVLVLLALLYLPASSPPVSGRSPPVSSPPVSSPPVSSSPPLK